MRAKTSIIALLATLGSLVSSPAGSTIYTWQDQNGVVSFTDDPKSAPSDAKVKVWSNDSAPQGASSNNSSEIIPDATDKPIPEQMQATAPSPVTQGEFAVQLVTELGLGKQLGPEEAADLLTRIRIAPPLGRWEFNEPMTPELTVRLRTLTVAATQMGWLTLTPDQALLSFDTTAALLGVVIPANSSPATAELSYPNVEIPPPLVYVTQPPPVVVSYYAWVPVVDGFWLGNTWFGGFFVLTSFHRHEFRHHRFFIDHEIIERRINDHIVNHRFGREPGPVSLHGRGSSVAPIRPNRTFDPTPRLHTRSAARQSLPSGIRSERLPFSQPGERVLIHPPPSLRHVASSQARMGLVPVSPSRPVHPPTGASLSARPPGMSRLSPPPSGGSIHGQHLRNAGRAISQSHRARS